MTAPKHDALFEAMQQLNNASYEDLTYQQLEFIAGRAVREYHEMTFGKPGAYHFKVPNNFVGRCIVWLLKRYVNPIYKFVAWGREPKVPRKRFASRTKLEDAGSIVLYLQRRKPNERRS